MTGLDSPVRPAPFREASIDLAVVRANAAVLARPVDGALVADLGADASGHGAASVARAVVDGGARSIVVWSIDEALAIRAEGVDVPISVGGAAGVDYARMGRADLTPLVAAPEEIEQARRAGVRRLGLVLETGAGTPGLDVEEVPRTWDGEVWLFAGLPDDDDPRRPQAERAIGSAVDRAQSLGLEVSGIVVSGGPRPGGLPASATAACLGSELFGLSHAKPEIPQGTTPAMTLWAPVVSIKRAGADEGVSYGFTHRTVGPSTLALVSLGYGDGVDRAASNRAPVSLRDRRYRISGRVAMDAFVIDLGGDDPPSLGDPAVLFGDPAAGHPSAAEWAEVLGTTAAEVTTRLTDRVRRSYR